MRNSKNEITWVRNEHEKGVLFTQLCTRRTKISEITGHVRRAKLHSKFTFSWVWVSFPSGQLHIISSLDLPANKIIYNVTGLIPNTGIEYVIRNFFKIENFSSVCLT